MSHTFYPLFTITIFTIRRMLKRGFNGFHSTLSRIRSLKSLILYSTSVDSARATTSPVVVDYFVKSIGFSETEAVAIVNKVRHPFTSTEKPKLVVDFLKESGLDETHIRIVVARFPGLLKFNVDKTLRPKIRFLQEVGFYGSDLALLISRNPYIMERDIESGIGPALGVLKSLFGSDEQLVAYMLQIRKNGILFPGSLKNIPANVMLLQNYGLTVERIKDMLARETPAFCVKWDEKMLTRVEEKLGIPRTSAMFIYGLRALTKKSEENVESWLQVLRSYGWRESEISRLLREHPLCLGMSENMLRLKLKYFMEDHGYGSDYLATVPTMLSYSMEKRILPRVAILQALKDEHLLKASLSLCTYLRMSDSEFKERCVLPYKDALLELYEKMGFSPSRA